MMSMDDIKLNCKWIYVIGSYIYNDKNVLIFYNIIDIVNSDLSAKTITKQSHKEITYLLSVLLWLFVPNGEDTSKDIDTLKRHINISFDVPKGYNADILNIVRHRNFGETENKQSIINILITLNKEVIKHLANINYDNIKKVSIVLHEIIFVLTDYTNN